MPNGEQARARNKILRILMLIDALAHLRMPFTLQDAKFELEERSGSQFRACDRTLERDLKVLIDMNLAYVHRQGIRGCHGAGAVPTLYKMNLIGPGMQTAIAKIKSSDRARNRT